MNAITRVGKSRDAWKEKATDRVTSNRYWRRRVQMIQVREAKLRARLRSIEAEARALAAQAQADAAEAHALKARVQTLRSYIDSVAPASRR